MQPEISIIIPAYNEESRIANSLEKAFDYLDKSGITYEILVVDDGSQDKTLDVLESFKEKIIIVKQPQNMGKGAAVRRGMLESNGKIRLFSDADFSTPVYELPKLIENIKNGADICIGSRAIDRSMVKEHQPFYREFMGKIFNKFVQVLVFKGITDTQCGFKAFTEKAVNQVFNRAKINGFSFDVEILYLAKLENLKVEQVPVEWYNDERSTVHPIKDSARMFFELFKIRKLHRR